MLALGEEAQLVGKIAQLRAKVGRWATIFHNPDDDIMIEM